MGFFGAAHGWATSYNDETWHSYTLPKEDPKNYKSRDTPLEHFFHRKSANFATSRNTHIDWILIDNF